MVLTLAILSACSVSPLAPQDTPPALFSKLDNNSAFFLKKAEESSKKKSLPWQFVATQALIAEQKPLMADSIIEYLDSQALTPVEQNALTLLTASNLYLRNNLQETQAALTKVNKQQLSEFGLIYFLKLRTQLHIDKEEHLEAAEQLFLLTPLLKDAQEKQQYHDLLLIELSLLPRDFLQQFQLTAQSESSALEFAEQQLDTAQGVTPVDPQQQVKDGWYALAYLYQRYQLRPNQLLRSLDDWKSHYPDHPAISFMPTQLTELPELSPYQPENIAVLLPLSGRYKQQGQAIQYGLLDAYYRQQKADRSAKVKLHFYDTQAQSMAQIAEQLQTQAIDFVVGPLLKNNIAAFLPLAAEMPVLALNSFPKQAQSAEAENSQVAWHYAFPLSPEEEAKQAARFIFAQAHKKPLLLAADSNYGKRIAAAFNQQWAALNGNNQAPVETHFFSSKKQFPALIARALHTNQSKRRISQMKVITNLPLQTKQRSRRDVDAIYIVSKRDDLLMLKAFIDVAISPFAATIPLYASSRSHQRDNHNQELSKLVFSDSPFLLNADNKARQEIEQTWGKQSFSALRLFALGFDSYQLIGHLIQLQNSEQQAYKGLVGQLSLDASNNVLAELSWAKYQRGKLLEITAPASAE